MTKSDHTFDEELAIDEFRVAIFGSARTKKDEEIYKNVADLAKSLGERDIDVVSGGGPGMMEAANYGHQLAKNGNAHSIGLTIELPFEAEGNKHMDLKKHFNKFSNRLDHFMMLSNVVVVVPGGIGTALELFYTWQLTQVKHMKNIPIILHGKMWHELMEWVKDEPLKRALMDKEDFQNIFCVSNNEEALEIIDDWQKKYNEKGDAFCANYPKYNVEGI